MKFSASRGVSEAHLKKSLMSVFYERMPRTQPAKRTMPGLSMTVSRARVAPAGWPGTMRYPGHSPYTLGESCVSMTSCFCPLGSSQSKRAPTLVGDECAHQMHCVVRFAIGPGVHLRDGYIADGLCRVAGAQNVEAGLEVDNLLVHRPRQMIVDTVSVVLIMRVRYGDNVSGGLNINVNRSI